MILGREAYRRVAWNNGGGVTEDVLVEGDPMRRRLSLATISHDGPFSDFSGYDRVFILASGAGVALRSPELEPAILDRPGALHAFAGERAIACALLDGEATAFNVMTRRATDRAQVTVHRLRRGEVWTPPPATDYVFAIAGALASGEVTLRPSDTLRIEAGDAARWTAQELGLVVAVTFDEVASE